MLIYDRIESNRRKTAVVVSLFVLATFLFVVYVAMWLTAFVVWAATDSHSPAGQEQFTFQLLTAALAAMGALPLVSYLGYSSSPKLLLRMVRARRVGPNQEPELRRTVENLSIGAGLAAPRLYVVESPAPNAFAVGLDAEHASVVVTRGLLRLLEPSELEGVIAHEFSHIGNQDTRLNMVSAALVITLRLPVSVVRGLWSLARYIVNRSEAKIPTAITLLAYSVIGAPAILCLAIFFPVSFWTDFGFLGPAMLLLPLHVFVLAPLLSPRVCSAISRDREYLADADAVLLTRNPEGLARALAKIAAAGRPSYFHAAVAPFYIADPSGPALRGSRTHPPIEERIARLAELARIPPSALASATRDGASYGQTAEATPPPATFAGSSESIRVFRLNVPAPLLKSPAAGAPIMVQLPESALIIAFEREGDFWQAVTADRVFGYMCIDVSLSPVDMDPADVQAHLPPPPPGQATDDQLTDSQKIAIILLLALAFFVVSSWLLLNFVPR